MPRAPLRRASARHLVYLAVFTWLSACVEPSSLDHDALDSGAVDVHLAVSDRSAPSGSLVAISLVALMGDEGSLAGVEGSIDFDPMRLSFVGVLPEVGQLFATGAPVRGQLRYFGIAPAGFETRVGTLVFEVTGPGYAESLRHSGELFIDRGARQLGIIEDRTVHERPAADTERAVLFSPYEWARWLDPNIGSSPPQRVPGEGTIFGDAFVDGSINVLDVAHIANIAVGNQELILNSDGPSRDAVLAGNVRPENPPGLGEAGDPCPPGLDVCGQRTRTLNVLDGLAVALESLGTDQTVVGESIPRPTPTGTAVLSGSLVGTRTLAADTVYAITDTVRVGDGSTTAGELVLPPGARVELATTGALIVERNGRISALGTAAAPVVFSCQGGASPGCWSGIAVNGNAPINGGTATSPSIAGRSGGGCAESTDSMGAYGGCSAADSSGVLRYVRFDLGGLGGTPPLDLRGVGSGTVLEHVYSTQSASVGMRVVGGTVDFKFVRIIAPGTAGLEWTRGWTGRGQYLVVQATSTTQAALRGRNNPADPDAAPRSFPHLRNVSTIGPANPAISNPGAGSLHLLDGTAGFFRSFLALSQPDTATYLVDVDGAATWAQLDAGTLALDSALVLGYGRLGALDDDSLATTALPYLSPDAESQWVRDSASVNTIIIDFDAVDGAIRGPWASVPDLRPQPLAATSNILCPSVGVGHPFFEAATFCGGVAPPFNTLGSVPWLEPAPAVDLTRVPLSPEPAFLSYLVESPQLGRLPGVSISGSTFGFTGLNGEYRSYVGPAGALVTIGNLPPTCEDPGQLVLLPPASRDSVFTGVLVQCP